MPRCSNDSGFGDALFSVGIGEGCDGDNGTERRICTTVVFAPTDRLTGPRLSGVATVATAYAIAFSAAVSRNRSV